MGQVLGVAAVVGVGYGIGALKGQDTSQTAVTNYLNVLTSKSVVRATTNCSARVEFRQHMRVDCRPPPPSETGGLWPEENEACLRCVELAETQLRAQLNTNLVLLGRARDERPVDETTGEPVPRAVVREIDLYRRLNSQLDSCTALCKACVFAGNSQFLDFSGTVECVVNTDVVKLVQDDIMANIKQDMTKDADVFSAVASLLPTGSSDSTSVTTLIEQRVTKLFTLEVLTSMKQNVDVSQLMAYVDGDATLSVGNSQSGVFATNMRTLQTLKVFDQVVSASEAAVMQKVVVDVNTTKRVAFTVGNAARKFADLYTTGAGLVAIIVAVVMFVVAVGLLMLFVSSGQTVKSFFGRGGTVRTGNLKANGRPGSTTKRRPPPAVASTTTTAAAAVSGGG